MQIVYYQKHELERTESIIQFISVYLLIYHYRDFFGLIIIQQVSPTRHLHPVTYA